MNNRIDRLAKAKFCQWLGASGWKYEQEPSYFYRLWESFVGKKRKHYPWDNRRYALQAETDQMMCKFIHDIYEEVSRQPDGQLIISFDN